MATPEQDQAVRAVVARKRERKRRAKHRELAYQLWIGPCGRNDHVVARAMTEAPHYVSQVTWETVRGWRKADRWDDRADREAGVARPLAQARVDDMADRGAIAAMSLLARIVEGVETETHVVTLKDADGEARAEAVQVAPKMRDRITAARTILEVAGKVGAARAIKHVATRGAVIEVVQARPLTAADRKALAAQVNDEEEEA